MTPSFTDLVGCRLPLQLAGMGGSISEPGLAAAVTEAGGLGMLAVGGQPPEVITAFIGAMAERTSGPFGVNVLMPFVTREAVVAAAAASIVEFFHAPPDPELVAIVRDAGSIAAWQVGSADEAAAAVAAGCAFVVVQGTEAGGHVWGKRSLDDVLRETVAAVDVPVLAAGGIGTAEDVMRVLAAGASGVRIGTRFLAATESIAHPDYVDALIAAARDDTVLTETFSSGWPNAPHRVLRTCVDAVEATDDEVVSTVTFHGDDLPVERYSPMPPTTMHTGNIAAMAMYAGTSVGGVERRQPAREIVDELCSAI